MIAGMQVYQASARKYRPMQFSEVLGQDAVVATLKNSIRLRRIPHALLFSGSRGTGKTTLARLMAKAVNCSNLSEGIDPCNECPSCREIQSGSSLNVLEIDGASHRGIDDIRRITETVGYSISKGSFKLYIIDEVHMLTKEAFNALLKTLEEPPPNALFIFATTEPHKIPKTILSRCQHFHLNRIPSNHIVQKLRRIARDANRQVADEALKLLAEMAEGGLRDAESLLDQILSFRDGAIDEKSLQELFGWMDRSVFFHLDQAGKAGDFKAAFELSDQLFSTGKDLSQFIDDLIHHFRILTKMHLGLPLDLTPSLKEQYHRSFSLYTKEQVLELFEMLVKAPDELRFHPEPRIALEALLLRILRSHFQIPLDFLVQQLSSLENGGQGAIASQPAHAQPVKVKLDSGLLSAQANTAPRVTPIASQAPTATPIASQAPMATPIANQAPTATPIANQAPMATPIANQAPMAPSAHASSIPTPIGNSATKILGQKEETMIQFAAVELEGTIKRHL